MEYKEIFDQNIDLEKISKLEQENQQLKKQIEQLLKNSKSKNCNHG